MTRTLSEKARTALIKHVSWSSDEVETDMCTSDKKAWGWDPRHMTLDGRYDPAFFEAAHDFKQATEKELSSFE